MKKIGKLTLIPTPIDDQAMISHDAFELLKNLNFDKQILLVEEPKASRRRWLKWGLPRESIEFFRLYNEHNQANEAAVYIEKLRQGKDVLLMSDCGLPAFCDPGQILVDLCHRDGIEVNSTSFSNSVILALALSGFEHRRFSFLGFPPREKSEREKFFNEASKIKESVILMDTPYRYKKVLLELEKHCASRYLFIGMDLGKKEQRLLRGNIKSIIRNSNDLKGEYVICLAPLSFT